MYQDNFDSQELGMTVVNFDFDGDCDMCAILGWDCSTCIAKAESKESNDDFNAHELHAEDRLGENGKAEHLTTSPSASEWVSAVTLHLPKNSPSDKSPLFMDILEPFYIEQKYTQRHEFLESVTDLSDRIFEVSDFSDYYEYDSIEALCNRCDLTFNKNLKTCPTCQMADAS